MHSQWRSVGSAKGGARQWRRQPKKVGGPNHFSLLVSSKELQYTYMGYPLYIKKTFQRICANLRRGLNISGGPDPPIPPVSTPLGPEHPIIFARNSRESAKKNFSLICGY